MSNEEEQGIKEDEVFSIMRDAKPKEFGMGAKWSTADSLALRLNLERVVIRSSPVVAITGQKGGGVL